MRFGPEMTFTQQQQQEKKEQAGIGKRSGREHGLMQVQFATMPAENAAGGLGGCGGCGGELEKAIPRNGSCSGRRR